MSEPLNNCPPDLARYQRQMLLPMIGEQGQRKLADATALVVGCGALGSMSAMMLARAGVGRLILVDRDFVEPTNLQRQVLYDENDLDVPKAEAAHRRLATINSNIAIEAVIDDLNYQNAEDLAERADAIVDGLDNFETRFLLNDLAVDLGLPLLYAGAVGTVAMTMNILPHTPAGDSAWEQQDLATPCLRCVFGSTPPPGSGPTCDTAGVLGPAVGLIANLQAAEAIKALTGQWHAMRRTMLHVDLWENHLREMQVASAYESGGCPCCGEHRFEFLEGKTASRTTKLCGRNAVQLSRSGDAGEIALPALAQKLEAFGQVQHNELMLRARIRDAGTDYELTVFNTGRAIVKGTEDPGVARSLYARYVGG